MAIKAFENIIDDLNLFKYKSLKVEKLLGRRGGRGGTQGAKGGAANI